MNHARPMAQQGGDVCPPLPGVLPALSSLTIHPPPPPKVQRQRPENTSVIHPACDSGRFELATRRCHDQGGVVFDFGSCGRSLGSLYTLMPGGLEPELELDGNGEHRDAAALGRQPVDGFDGIEAGVAGDPAPDGVVVSASRTTASPL